MRIKASIPRPAAEAIYTLRIELDGSKPCIWREVQVVDVNTLLELHNVIQIAMGWQNCHLHLFEIGKKQYCERHGSELIDDAFVDEASVLLRDVIKRKGQRFAYVYDMGDGWEHNIKLISTAPADPEACIPLCLGGENACPPEDSGGIFGYYHMLDVLSDPEHDDFEMYDGWLDKNFDFTKFDVTKVNRKLARSGMRRTTR